MSGPSGTWERGLRLAMTNPRASSYMLAAVLFLCAWTVLSWPWLSGAVTIPFDAKAHFQAQIQFLARVIHAGQSPFWTPNVFGGSPQVADPQSLIFSPAVLLAAFSSAPSFRLVDAYVLAHLAAGGLAILMIFRDRGWHPAGGVMAALVFAFGASASWRLQHVGQIASLAVFGVALWLTLRMIQRRSVLWGALAGAAAGVMMVEPDQVALLGAYILVFLVLADWIGGGEGALRKGILPAVAAAVAGLAVAAVPLLWTWLFAEATTRPAIDLVEAGRGSLHPASLLTAIFGDLFGARDGTVEFWGPYNGRWGAAELYLSENMGQVYLGALPFLLLVAPGLTRGWLFERPVRALTILLALMILFALGRYTPAFELFYHYVPGINAFRRPADATFLIGALAAVLSGYVLHRLLTEGLPGGAWREIVVVIALVAVAGAIGAGEAVRLGKLAEATRPLLAGAVWFGIGLVIVVLAPRWRGRAAGGMALALLAGVMVADLRANNGPSESTGLPPAMYDVLRPDTQNETVTTLKRLLRQPPGSLRRDRVELAGLGFEWPNAGMVHGFDHTLGYNPLRLADFSEAVGTRDTIADPRERQFTPLFPSYRCRLADFLGLRYIATPVPIEKVDRRLKPGDLQLVARTHDGFIYENPRALPRVQFAGGWQFADFDAMKASGQWPQVDPDQAVLLDQEPTGTVKEGARTVRAAVSLVRYETTEVEIAVNAQAPGFVVLNDIWHPWWRAEVNGAETEILKANVLFRAVEVPAGKSKVVFSFRPLAGAIAELRERLEPEAPEPARPHPDRPADEPAPAVAARPIPLPSLPTLGLSPADRNPGPPLAAIEPGSEESRAY